MILLLPLPSVNSTGDTQEEGGGGEGEGAKSYDGEKGGSSAIH